MNPFANENNISKIKTKTDKNNNFTNPKGSIVATLIGMNDAINICAQACSCCWDKPIPDDFDKLTDYIAKRSLHGHTSILEHSNYVLYISIPNGYEEDTFNFLNWVKYLNYKIIKSSDNNRWHLIIGGSFRGYADIYRETDDLNNPILQAVTGNLYTYSHSGVFADICKLGFMDKDKFLNVKPDKNFNIITKYPNRIECELFDIVGCDSIQKLYENLYNTDKDAAKKISSYDLIKFITITVMFKNMSRTCTHQLVRHRNAITQESQRYVSNLECEFSSPDMFKPDRYDKNHKYKIKFSSTNSDSMTLSEIGKSICGIYSQLNDSSITGSKYALTREDARAFLPSNVQCRKIYITFTFKNLFKFLYLREDKAAQSEIRVYANALGWWVTENTEFNSKELRDAFTEPRLIVGDPFSNELDVKSEDQQSDELITIDNYINSYPSEYKE